MQTSYTRAPTPEDDSEEDSDCPRPSYRGRIQFKSSEVTHLQYDSNIGQFNDWLIDLKTAFDGDPKKYPTNRYKVIFASMTLDGQLKSTFNSIASANSSVLRHWRKFKRCIEGVVLRGESDKLKLSNEFTGARQRFAEDPNQFYIRLFNLGIQAGRTIEVEDYKTRLIRPLQNLILQHNHKYSKIQDLIADASRLWQTLDVDKIRREIKDEKDRAYQKRQADRTNPQSKRPDRDSGQQGRQSTSKTSRQPRQDQQQGKTGNPIRQLPTEEYQYRKDKGLCLRCGYPGHQIHDCEHRFNPNRVSLRNEPNNNTNNNNGNKSQQPQGQKRPRPFAKTQPVAAEGDETELEPMMDSDDASDEPPAKRSKN